MKCLVTGGAGFIGSHLVESLLSDGHHVTVIDDLSTGQIKNLDEVITNPKLEFIKGDILNLPELEYLVEKSDIVYHLAAAVGVELVVSDPVKTIVTNVHGTENILKGAARKGTRVLIASTSEVYGKSEKEIFSEDNDLLIGPSTHSRWSYACSKLLDEFYSMAYYRSIKLPIVVARFFNTVGPKQTGRYGMVIPRFVKNALEGTDLNVYGTGEQTRCFTHVHDSIKAIKLLAESDISGEVFNVGSENNISINELAAQIIRLLNSKSKIKHISYDEAYEEGFEDMLHRYPDISKIQKSFDWKPTYSLNNIINDVADYYRAQ
jgi:UDP-glucose 4-epimerase